MHICLKSWYSANRRGSSMMQWEEEEGVSPVDVDGWDWVMMQTCS